MAAVTSNGDLEASWGDIEAQFWFRSAAKPFQAAVSQRLGAGLTPEALAVASSSHHAHSVQVAYVQKMLSDVGLDESALQTPASWPLSLREARARAAAGHRAPRSIWSDCSGKHAAMLRACLAQGWPIETYRRPDHPLQQAVAEMLGCVTETDPGRPGVDGCGVPVFRVSAVGLARAYSKLASAPELAAVKTAMHRFPALVSSEGTVDHALATWLDAAAKSGAEACLGVALSSFGGIGLKAWDGTKRGLGPAAVEALDLLGVLPEESARRLAQVRRPDVLGGGVPAGWVEPALGS